MNSRPNPTVQATEVETACTICAEHMPNYLPKYFSNIEINPACENCRGSSVSSVSSSNESHSSTGNLEVLTGNSKEKLEKRLEALKAMLKFSKMSQKTKLFLQLKK